jgi:hypothetical protein
LPPRLAMNSIWASFLVPFFHLVQFVIHILGESNRLKGFEMCLINWPICGIIIS